MKPAVSTSLTGGILDPDLLFSVLTQLAHKIPALVAAMVLTRVFSQNEMGGFFFASAYAFFFSLFVNFGTNLHLVRAVAADPGSGLARLGEVLAWRLLLTVTVLVIMNSIVFIFTPDVALIVLLTSLFFLLGDLSHPFGAYLSGLRRFRLRFLLVLSGAAFLVVSVSLAVYLGATLPQVLACYVASSLFTVAMSILTVRVGFGPIPLPYSTGVIRRLALLCWPLLLLDVLQVAQFKVDTLMIFAFVTADEVARYETAYRLLEVTRLAGRPLAMVAFPVCVALATQGQWNAVARQLRKTVFLAAAIGLGLALVVAVAPSDIMAAVWGEGYRDSGPLLRVLFLTAPLLLMDVVCGSLANAVHLERTLIVIMSLATVLNFALNLWAVPIWGATGAAWTTLATEAAITLSLVLVWQRTLLARAETSVR